MCACVYRGIALCRWLGTPDSLISAGRSGRDWERCVGSGTGRNCPGGWLRFFFFFFALLAIDFRFLEAFWIDTRSIFDVLDNLWAYFLYLIQCSIVNLSHNSIAFL